MRGKLAEKAIWTDTKIRKSNRSFAGKSYSSYRPRASLMIKCILKPSLFCYLRTQMIGGKFHTLQLSLNGIDIACVICFKMDSRELIWRNWSLNYEIINFIFTFKTWIQKVLPQVTTKHPLFQNPPLLQLLFCWTRLHECA